MEASPQQEKVGVSRNALVPVAGGVVNLRVNVLRRFPVSCFGVVPVCRRGGDGNFM